MTADDDYKLLDIGIGFTNIVERTTRGSGNLTRKEIFTRGILPGTPRNQQIINIK